MGDAKNQPFRFMRAPRPSKSNHTVSFHTISTTNKNEKGGIMGRTANTTYEDVKAAAEALVAGGQTPSGNLVLAKLSSGSSKSTVLPLLNRWRQEQREKREGHTEIPQEVASALLAYIGKQTSRLTEGLREELSLLNQEIASVISESEERASQIDLLGKELSIRSAQKSESEGKALQLERDLREAKSLAREEREKAESAQAELDQAKHIIDTVDRIQEALSKCQEDLSRESSARESAERRAASATASEQALSRRIADLQSDLKAREENAARERERAESSEERERALSNELGNMKAERAAALERSARDREELESAKRKLEELENKERELIALKARIPPVQQRQQDLPMGR